MEPHTRCAKLANELALEVNAGHDLNLDNLRFYSENVLGLKEVSIGHALISDALYFGLENTIQMYLNCLKPLSSLQNTMTDEKTKMLLS